MPCSCIPSWRNAAVVLTMLLAHRIKGNRVLNLVVIGIVVQAIMSAALMLLKISADPNQELASIEYWLMGGFSNATWTSVGIAFILIAVSFALLYLFSLANTNAGFW